MNRYKQLQREYEELQQKYTVLYAKEAEMEYEYRRMKEDAAERKLQDQELHALHKNVRKMKHDMKNHFMVLSAYLASEDYEGAKTYASEILDKLNTMYSYVETGNILMNHIINEKFRCAMEQGIMLKAEVENRPFARMSGMDFTALLSNMLDNAVEASMEEKEREREIILLILAKQGYEMICVKNRIADSVLDKNPDLATTKKQDSNTHGIGIARIKEIAEQYNGMYDIYEKDGYFSFSVFIPQ